MIVQLASVTLINNEIYNQTNIMCKSQEKCATGMFNFQSQTCNRIYVIDCT